MRGQWEEFLRGSWSYLSAVLASWWAARGTTTQISGRVGRNPRVSTSTKTFDGANYSTLARTTLRSYRRGLGQEQQSTVSAGLYYDNAASASQQQQLQEHMNAQFTEALRRQAQQPLPQTIEEAFELACRENGMDEYLTGRRLRDEEMARGKKG